MAKKALVSTIEPRGKDNAGYRVLEVVDAANTFETHANLQWHNCPDTVEIDKYWYNPTTQTFHKMPEAVDPFELLGPLARNSDGEPTEYYHWDWDQETFTSKRSIL